ncbi:hypothetical protein FDK38_004942 [Candidozyma auris]|nr:hypothetical protein FDK38_004942 [[Candida] auris]
MSWFQQPPFQKFVDINVADANKECPETCPAPASSEGLEIHCGPIIRLCGSWEQKSPNYRASILLVTKGETQPEISYAIGPANESLAPQGWKAPVEGTFPVVNFHTEEQFQFWRFNVKFDLEPYEQLVRYSVNGQKNDAHFFFIPAAEASMNVMSFSCNGFSLSTDTSSFKSSLWLDVLRKHHQQQHYHVMLGGGDQIYCDSIKLHVQSIQEWLNATTASRKRKIQATPEMADEMGSYYLHAYLEWFGQGYWKGTNGGTHQTLFPLAMSQIPSVNIFDDHDIIDGFGSYKDRTMASQVFSTIGNVAYKYYMLFQHHISVDEEACHSDPSWILSKKPGKFIKQRNHSLYMRLGKEISLLGMDCRTERRLTQIIDPDTYNVIFKRLQDEISQTPETKHLLVMLGVPILYPRMVWLEWLLTSRILKPIRGLATRGLVAKGLVNEFDGSVEVLDDLNDHWCSKHHKRERNALVKRLIDFGATNGVRVTILSGDVHLGCIGRIKTKLHHHPNAHVRTDVEKENQRVTDTPQNDPRLIFNIISSAIVNAPPPDVMPTLLGRQNKVHKFDSNTAEDIVPIFNTNPDGTPRDNPFFLNKRNWSDLILVKQSPLYADAVNSGESKFPCSNQDHDREVLADQEIDEQHIKYPILENSLVTTLYVENDGNDLEATTAGYEVMIPDLQGKFKLQKTHIKHLS